MYGMPQPNTYGQYGFGAYATTPGGNPGMPSPGTGNAAAGIGMPTAQAGATDPSAAGQAAQGQWGSADAASYYQNYWGGASDIHQSR